MVNARGMSSYHEIICICQKFPINRVRNRAAWQKPALNDVYNIQGRRQRAPLSIPSCYRYSFWQSAIYLKLSRNGLVHGHNKVQYIILHTKLVKHLWSRETNRVSLFPILWIESIESPKNISNFLKFSRHLYHTSVHHNISMVKAYPANYLLN